MVPAPMMGSMGPQLPALTWCVCRTVRMMKSLAFLRQKGEVKEDGFAQHSAMASAQPSQGGRWTRCCPHLTSSMNLSLGASLTSSLLMAKIWSPGSSLSSEGPPAGTEARH